MASERGVRTTLTLDPEVLDAARRLADARSQSVGVVISALARAGLRGMVEAVPRGRGAFPVFRVFPGVAPLTLSDVKRDEDRA